MSPCSKASWPVTGTIGSYMADGVIPEPMGTAYKTLLPYQTFRTKTKDLALAVGSDKLWRLFCPILGLAEMLDDPRYATNAARVQNRDTLIPKLQEVFNEDLRGMGSSPAGAGYPDGAINTIDQVVKHPQVQARGMIVESEHPVAGKSSSSGCP